jgi:hypothetical protein
MQRQAPARRTPAAPAGHPHRTQCGRASRRPWTHNSHPQGDPHRHRRRSPARPPPRRARPASTGTQVRTKSAQLTSPRCSSALATKVLRAGHAALGLGRPQRCWRPLRMQARPRRWAASTPGWRAWALRQRRQACSLRASAGWFRMVGGAHDKGPQRTEVRLYRISPRRVRRREAQPGVFPPGPAADRRGLVRRQVVQDDEQPVPAGPGGPDRLPRGQGVHGALVLAGHAPQLVITHAGSAAAAPARWSPARPDGRLNSPSACAGSTG